MKRNVIMAMALIILFSTIVGLYVRNKITQNEIKAEQVVLHNLKQEAESYLSKFIAAVESGNHLEISKMVGGSPEDYKDLKGISMTFIDKKMDKEIVNSYNITPVYILKFQAIETDKAANKYFSLFNGFYYMTVRLIKEKDGWRVASLSTGEHFN
jgi:uncharacterized membrane protein (DUF106 family)